MATLEKKRAGRRRPHDPARRLVRHTSSNGHRPSSTNGTSGLTTPQIRRLEERLLQERERALRTLSGTRLDIERHAMGDLRKQELDIHLAERHTEFLTLIDGALRRLRECPEDFDVSIVSGKRISFERLEFVPWARCLPHELE